MGLGIIGGGSGTGGLLGGGKSGGGIFGALKSAGSWLWGKAKQLFGGATSSLKDAGKGLLNTAMDYGHAYTKELGDRAGQIAGAASAGMNQVGGAIQNALSNFGSSVDSIAAQKIMPTVVPGVSAGQTYMDGLRGMAASARTGYDQGKSAAPMAGVEKAHSQ